MGIQVTWTGEMGMQMSRNLDTSAAQMPHAEFFCPFEGFGTGSMVEVELMVVAVQWWWQ